MMIYNENLTQNRAFLYGDGLFETILVKNKKPVFLEEHYFRLLSGMRQLVMNIPDHFSLSYFKTIIQQKIDFSTLDEARIRINVYRESKGLYYPEENKIYYSLDIQEFTKSKLSHYTLGLYKTHYVSQNSIDNLKTTNRLVSVLASIYAREQHFENVVLLNAQKKIASAYNGNIFLLVGTTWLTPSLSEGCIAGIIREKFSRVLAKKMGFEVKETAIEPYVLTEANEVLITNSIMGIQPVTQYKNKDLQTDLGLQIKAYYENWINSTVDFQEN